MSQTNQITGTGQSAGSYQKRKLDITITLGQGTFGQTGTNTVKLSGLRVVASIDKRGYPSMDRAQARVYGVPPSIMNEVSTLGIPLTMWRAGNAMLIEAGDAANGMSVVYSGYLHQAWQDFDDVPDTFLMLIGWGGQDKAIFPVAPISFKGSADVATLLQGIADRSLWKFENSGVRVQLANPYFSGTALEQVHAIGRAANIEVYIDTNQSPNVLACWPKYATRGGLVPLINTKSGLVNYPRFQSNGMGFRCIFNPNIRIGGQIQMESTAGGSPTMVNTAQGGNTTPSGTQSGGPNGLWAVISPLTYSLAAEMPGGDWFTDVSCARVAGPGNPK